MENDYLEKFIDFKNINIDFNIEHYSSTQLQYIWEINPLVDIFSELPREVFQANINKQMFEIMTSFQKAYTEYIMNKDISIGMPKLKYHKDEEGASIIQMNTSWDSGNASMYFAFEVDDDDSSFGFVWNDEKKRNYETKSGSIKRNSKEDIIRDTLDFIFRVY